MLVWRSGPGLTPGRMLAPALMSSSWALEAVVYLVVLEKLSEKTKA
jgi:hypothetical protein